MLMESGVIMLLKLFIMIALKPLILKIKTINTVVRICRKVFLIELHLLEDNLNIHGKLISRVYFLCDFESIFERVKLTYL